MNNSLIDTEKLSDDSANMHYQYAGLSDINNPTSGVKMHCIMCKPMGRNQKWTLLADGKQPLQYASEADARSDVSKVNQWKKAIKRNVGEK